MNTRAILLGLLTFGLLSLHAEQPVQLQLQGDWEIAVAVPAGPGHAALKGAIRVPRPVIYTVTVEKHAALPVFRKTGGGWSKGDKLAALRTQETTLPYMLVADSLVLRAGPTAASPAFVRGQDYEADLTWATIGRLAGGSIKEGQPVYVSYQHALLRLDSIVLTSSGGLGYRQGKAQANGVLPPELKPGEQRLANIWLPGAIQKLTADNLFPVLETAYPEPKHTGPSVAEKLIPKTLHKLQAGETVRILAWGDSVTVGTHVPDPEKNRWQMQFLSRLRARFPKAKIELTTEAWGGRNTGSYLGEPPGSEHNYKEKVLAVKPDLIVSEFVNDASLKPAQVEERYSKLLADFQQMGTEWIILSPHYTRPDWMGLTREREIDNDPRPYVQGLREFTTKHHIALADASLRYGRLWRQGIPYSTIMLNSINHPDVRGMKIFADSLMELFP